MKHLSGQSCSTPQRSVWEKQTVVGVAVGAFAKKQKSSASWRERCRINQARYRKKQHQHEGNLVENIRQLNKQVQDQSLGLKLRLTTKCKPVYTNVWLVATEYFHLFHHGYVEPVSVPASASPGTSSTTLAVQQPRTQLEFLQATMTSDVTDSVECGPDAILESWRLLSLYCEDVSVQLKHLVRADRTSLLATTVVCFTITKHTLHYLFPHVTADQVYSENQGVRFPLATKLLNQRLMVRGSVRFDWDDRWYDWRPN
ncbi:hypothetical protein PI125_g18351 [Phytophthora idaei]|nr:hypothetical protein PI125_g18351 [Phytophthora idaei]KAG3135191.1 hypothetical protein PI126_g18359 [Phytophthora idaei]